MAIVADIKDLVNGHAAGDKTRILILHDEHSGKTVGGRFDHEYGLPVFKDALTSMFDTTSDILAVSLPDHVFDSRDLPIVASVGPWQITLVTRTKNNEVIVQNARDETIDGQLGIGG
jgi:hypothetical protein